jgi:ParB/RepB/Spo0J family partition protein
MANAKRLRDALLSSSVDAMQAGRGAVSGVAQQMGTAWLPVREIAPDPDQPRTHYDSERMKHLVESIRAIGQVEPILVQALKVEEQRPGEPYRYRCLSGHRRLRAYQELDLAEIKAVIVRDNLSAEQRLVREIASNEVREDHTDFDRARFMALLFAGRIAEIEPADEKGKTRDHPPIEAVKQLVNRAFNEFDRTGQFSPASRAVIEACEESLKAVGERRNTRWFHRWGAPLLALEGAALEAAVAGLDARRSLAIAQLAPRGATLTVDERKGRETLIRGLALAVKASNIPHRELALLVKDLAAAAGAHGANSPHVASILSGIKTDEENLSSVPPDSHDRVHDETDTTTSAAERRLDSPNVKSLRRRARILASRWNYRPGPPPKGGADAIGGQPADLLELVDHLATHAPRSADRILRALEKADRDTATALAVHPQRAHREGKRDR